MDTCKRCRSCRWRGLYLADSSEEGESLGTDKPDPVLKAHRHGRLSDNER